MHLFISAGEPSGDLHGANLVRALRSRHPDVRITGFGGERMRAAGADLLFPLTDLAVMGVRRVVANLRTFFRLADQARTHFETERPDAVVLIDYPGFNFALAKRAHAAGIPVYYFVPPQIWAWRTGRVKKVRQWCDTVLTALPFEETWYRDRGVNTRYVGHPYFDELAAQRPDPGFLAAQRSRAGPVVALLPGSRCQEVTANLPLMLAAAARVHAARPDGRFLVASFNEEQAALARALAGKGGLPLEIHAGRTPEIIERAESCIAVSGSVGLELMYRLKPTVVVYRMGRLFHWLILRLIHVKYMSLVNLLAGEEVYPEFAPAREAEPIAEPILRWLNNPVARAAVVGKLQELKDRVAVPGACERAAEVLLAGNRSSGKVAA